MKGKLKLAAVAAAMLLSTAGFAQTKSKGGGEKFGNTLNLGLGLGYGGIGGGPGILANYEFDVARNFTLAPFVGFVSHSGHYYRHTIMPIGVKGSYYFDELLNAPSDWDFYLAGSLGFSINSITYESKYAGGVIDDDPLFLLFHIGAEYHVSQKVGIYLDLGTALSTIGVAVHF